MRAVVYHAVGALPRLREVAEPACPADGVVVEVTATGVCRSDWHAWVGHDPVELPHVPGHELAGRVRAVGPRVRRWREGDRVTVPFVCGCGTCETCRSGEPQVCPRQTQPGFTDWGSFAERVALHAADTNLVALPAAIDDVAAAALGCRFATAYRAVTAHARLGPQEWLAVHGVGGLGLCAVAVGAALGARVVAVDRACAPLERARDLGAAHTICSEGRSSEEVAAEVHERSGGVHASIDALGAPEVARQSVLSLRRRGRHVQAGLLLGAAGGAPLPMDRIVAWELSIHGTHGLAARDYPALFSLVEDRIDLAALVGRVVPLEEAPAALAAMSRPSTGAGLTVVRL